MSSYPISFPEASFDVYVEVNFLSQLIFKFTLFLGMECMLTRAIMALDADEYETKVKLKMT